MRDKLVYAKTRGRGFGQVEQIEEIYNPPIREQDSYLYNWVQELRYGFLIGAGRDFELTSRFKLVSDFRFYNDFSGYKKAVLLQLGIGLAWRA